MDALRARSYMDEDARMRLPNPDELLFFGYAIHCASNKSLRGTPELALAKKSAEEFISLTVPADTPASYYLQSVRPIVLSHARGISRRKDEYIEKVKAANDLRREKEHQVSASRIDGVRITGQLLSLLWKFVMPIILGLTGFLIAKVIGNIVPDAVSDKTGTALPSVILGLTFALLGRYMGMWMYDRRRAQIIRECEITKSLAYEAYELGKYKEFELARIRFCEAWLQYTGEEYPDTVSYQTVIQADLAERLKLDEHLLNSKSDFERIVQLVQDTRKALSHKKRKKIKE